RQFALQFRIPLLRRVQSSKNFGGSSSYFRLYRSGSAQIHTTDFQSLSPSAASSRHQFLLRASLRRIKWHHNLHYFSRRPGNEDRSKPVAKSASLSTQQYSVPDPERTFCARPKTKTNVFCRISETARRASQNRTGYKTGLPPQP